MQEVQVHFEMLSISTQAIWCHSAQEYHKLPIKLFALRYGRRTNEHMGWCDLVPFLRVEKANVPTLGPRFLVKFPRMGKAIVVNYPTYARSSRSKLNGIVTQKSDRATSRSFPCFASRILTAHNLWCH